MTETLPRYDLWRAGDGIALVWDEACDGDGAPHELDDHVYEVSGEYLCSECVRAKLLAHFKRAPANDLCDMPFEIYPAERCDQCSLYRCQCPEERE